MRYTRDRYNEEFGYEVARPLPLETFHESKPIAEGV